MYDGGFGVLVLVMAVVVILWILVVVVLWIVDGMVVV